WQHVLAELSKGGLFVLGPRAEGLPSDDAVEPLELLALTNELISVAGRLPRRGSVCGRAASRPDLEKETFSWPSFAPSVLQPWSPCSRSAFSFRQQARRSRPSPLRLAS